MSKTRLSESAGNVLSLHIARGGDKGSQPIRLARQEPVPDSSAVVLQFDSNRAARAKAPTSPWSWIFDFFMEGFALYGASLYPAGIIAYHAAQTDAHISQLVAAFSVLDSGVRREPAGLCRPNAPTSPQIGRATTVVGTTTSDGDAALVAGETAKET
jgi:hypothetical protein